MRFRADRCGAGSVELSRRQPQTTSISSSVDLEVPVRSVEAINRMEKFHQYHPTFLSTVQTSSRTPVLDVVVLVKVAALRELIALDLTFSPAPSYIFLPRLPPISNPAKRVPSSNLNLSRLSSSLVVRLPPTSDNLCLILFRFLCSSIVNVMLMPLADSGPDVGPRRLDGWARHDAKVRIS
jgi:hypothetical protein